MAMMVSEEVATLFFLLTGERFPDADEDKLRALAMRWREGARDLQQLYDGIRGSVAEVRSSFEGDAEQAFADRMAPWVEGAGLGPVGGDSSGGSSGGGRSSSRGFTGSEIRTGEGGGLIGSAIVLFESLADFLEKLAEDVEYIKLVIIYQLTLLLFEIWLAYMLSPFTGGAVWGPLMAKYAIVKKLMESLLGKLLLQFVSAWAIGSAFQLLVDVAAQLTQFGMGTRTDWNESHTRTAAEVAAVGAGISLVFVPLFDPVANAINKWLTKGFVGHFDDAGKVITTIGFGGVHEATTDLTYTGIKEGKVSDTWYGALAAGAVSSGAHELGSFLGKKYPWTDFDFAAWLQHRFTPETVGSPEEKLPLLSDTDLPESNTSDFGDGHSDYDDPDFYDDDPELYEDVPDSYDPVDDAPPPDTRFPEADRQPFREDQPDPQHSEDPDRGSFGFDPAPPDAPSLLDTPSPLDYPALLDSPPDEPRSDPSNPSENPFLSTPERDAWWDENAPDLTAGDEWWNVPLPSAPDDSQPDPQAPLPNDADVPRQGRDTFEFAPGSSTLTDVDRTSLEQVGKGLAADLAWLHENDLPLPTVPVAEGIAYAGDGEGVTARQESVQEAVRSGYLDALNQRYPEGVPPALTDAFRMELQTSPMPPEQTGPMPPPGQAGQMPPTAQTAAGPQGGTVSLRFPDFRPATVAQVTFEPRSGRPSPVHQTNARGFDDLDTALRNVAVTAVERHGQGLELPRLLVVPDATDGAAVGQSRAEFVGQEAEARLDAHLGELQAHLPATERLNARDVPLRLAKGPAEVAPGKVGLAVDWAIRTKPAPPNGPERFGPGGRERRGDDVLADPRWRHSPLKAGEQDPNLGLSATWMTPSADPITKAEVDRVRDSAPAVTVNAEFLDPVVGNALRDRKDGNDRFVWVEEPIHHQVAFDLRTMEVRPGQWVREWTVKVELRKLPGAEEVNVHDIIGRAQRELDQFINLGYRTPDGAQIQLRVELAEPGDRNALTVRVHPDENGTNSLFDWYPLTFDRNVGILAHELGHAIGMMDESLDNAHGDKGNRVLQARDPGSSAHYRRPDPVTGKPRKIAELENRVVPGGLYGGRSFDEQGNRVDALTFLPRYVWRMERTRLSLANERPATYGELVQEASSAAVGATTPAGGTPARPRDSSGRSDLSSELGDHARSRSPAGDGAGPHSPDIARAGPRQPDDFEERTNQDQRQHQQDGRRRLPDTIEEYRQLEVLYGHRSLEDIGEPAFEPDRSEILLSTHPVHDGWRILGLPPSRDLDGLPPAETSRRLRFELDGSTLRTEDRLELERNIRTFAWAVAWFHRDADQYEGSVLDDMEEAFPFIRTSFPAGTSGPRIRALSDFVARVLNEELEWIYRPGAPLVSSDHVRNWIRTEPSLPPNSNTVLIDFEGIQGFREAVEAGTAQFDPTPQSIDPVRLRLRPVFGLNSAEIHDMVREGLFRFGEDMAAASVVRSVAHQTLPSIQVLYPIREGEPTDLPQERARRVLSNLLEGFDTEANQGPMSALGMPRVNVFVGPIPENVFASEDGTYDEVEVRLIGPSVEADGSNALMAEVDSGTVRALGSDPERWARSEPLASLTLMAAQQAVAWHRQGHRPDRIPPLFFFVPESSRSWYLRVPAISMAATALLEQHLLDLQRQTPVDARITVEDLRIVAAPHEGPDLVFMLPRVDPANVEAQQPSSGQPNPMGGSPLPPAGAVAEATGQPEHLPEGSDAPVASDTRDTPNDETPNDDTSDLARRGPRQPDDFGTGSVAPATDPAWKHPDIENQIRTLVGRTEDAADAAQQARDQAEQILAEVGEAHRRGELTTAAYDRARDSSDRSARHADVAIEASEFARAGNENAARALDDLRQGERALNDTRARIRNLEASLDSVRRGLVDPGPGTDRSALQAERERIDDQLTEARQEERNQREAFENANVRFERALEALREAVDIASESLAVARAPQPSVANLRAQGTSPAGEAARIETLERNAERAARGTADARETVASTRGAIAVAAVRLRGQVGAVERSVETAHGGVVGTTEAYDTAAELTARARAELLEIIARARALPHAGSDALREADTRLEHALHAGTARAELDAAIEARVDLAKNHLDQAEQALGRANDERASTESAYQAAIGTPDEADARAVRDRARTQAEDAERARDDVARVRTELDVASGALRIASEIERANAEAMAAALEAYDTARGAVQEVHNSLAAVEAALEAARRHANEAQAAETEDNQAREQAHDAAERARNDHQNAERARNAATNAGETVAILERQRALLNALAGSMAPGTTLPRTQNERFEGIETRIREATEHREQRIAEAADAGRKYEEAMTALRTLTDAVVARRDTARSRAETVGRQETTVRTAEQEAEQASDKANEAAKRGEAESRLTQLSMHDLDLRIESIGDATEFLQAATELTGASRDEVVRAINDLVPDMPPNDREVDPVAVRRAIAAGGFSVARPGADPLQIRINADLHRPGDLDPDRPLTTPPTHLLPPEVRTETYVEQTNTESRTSTSATPIRVPILGVLPVDPSGAAIRPALAPGLVFKRDQKFESVSGSADRKNIYFTTKVPTAMSLSLSVPDGGSRTVRLDAELRVVNITRGTAGPSATLPDSAYGRLKPTPPVVPASLGEVMVRSPEASRLLGELLTSRTDQGRQVPGQSDVQVQPTGQPTVTFTGTAAGVEGLMTLIQSNNWQTVKNGIATLMFGAMGGPPGWYVGGSVNLGTGLSDGRNQGFESLFTQGSTDGDLVYRIDRTVSVRSGPTPVTAKVSGFVRVPAQEARALGLPLPERLADSKAVPRDQDAGYILGKDKIRSVDTDRLVNFIAEGHGEQASQAVRERFSTQDAANETLRNLTKGGDQFAWNDGDFKHVLDVYARVLPPERTSGSTTTAARSEFRHTKSLVRPYKGSRNWRIPLGFMHRPKGGDGEVGRVGRSFWREAPRFFINFFGGWGIDNKSGYLGKAARTDKADVEMADYTGSLDLVVVHRKVLRPGLVRQVFFGGQMVAAPPAQDRTTEPSRENVANAIAGNDPGHDLIRRGRLDGVFEATTARDKLLWATRNLPPSDMRRGIYLGPPPDQAKIDPRSFGEYAQATHVEVNQDMIDAAHIAIAKRVEPANANVPEAQQAPRRTPNSWRSRFWSAWSQREIDATWVPSDGTEPRTTRYAYKNSPLTRPRTSGRGTLVKFLSDVGSRGTANKGFSGEGYRIGEMVHDGRLSDFTGDLVGRAEYSSPRLVPDSIRTKSNLRSIQIGEQQTSSVRSSHVGADVELGASVLPGEQHGKGAMIRAGANAGGRHGRSEQHDLSPSMNVNHEYKGPTAHVLLDVRMRYAAKNLGIRNRFKETSLPDLPVTVDVPNGVIMELPVQHAIDVFEAAGKPVPPELQAALGTPTKSVDDPAHTLFPQKPGEYASYARTAVIRSALVDQRALDRIDTRLRQDLKVKDQRWIDAVLEQVDTLLNSAEGFPWVRDALPGDASFGARTQVPGTSYGFEDVIDIRVRAFRTNRLPDKPKATPLVPDKQTILEYLKPADQRKQDTSWTGSAAVQVGGRSRPAAEQDENGENAGNQQPAGYGAAAPEILGTGKTVKTEEVLPESHEDRELTYSATSKLGRAPFAVDFHVEIARRRAPAPLFDTPLLGVPSRRDWDVRPNGVVSAIVLQGEVDLVSPSKQAVPPLLDPGIDPVVEVLEGQRPNRPEPPLGKDDGWLLESIGSRTVRFLHAAAYAQLSKKPPKAGVVDSDALTEAANQASEYTREGGNSEFILHNQVKGTSLRSGGAMMASSEKYQVRNILARKHTFYDALLDHKLTLDLKLGELEFVQRVPDNEEFDLLQDSERADLSGKTQTVTRLGGGTNVIVEAGSYRHNEGQQAPTSYRTQPPVTMDTSADTGRGGAGKDRKLTGVKYEGRSYLYLVKEADIFQETRRFGSNWTKDAWDAARARLRGDRHRDTAVMKITPRRDLRIQVWESTALDKGLLTLGKVWEHSDKLPASDKPYRVTSSLKDGPVLHATGKRVDVRVAPGAGAPRGRNLQVDTSVSLEDVRRFVGSLPKDMRPVTYTVTPGHTLTPEEILSETRNLPDPDNAPKPPSTPPTAASPTAGPSTAGPSTAGPSTAPAGLFSPPLQPDDAASGSNAAAAPSTSTPPNTSGPNLVPPRLKGKSVIGLPEARLELSFAPGSPNLDADAAARLNEVARPLVETAQWLRANNLPWPKTWAELAGYAGVRGIGDAELGEARARAVHDALRQSIASELQRSRLEAEAAGRPVSTVTADEIDILIRPVEAGPGEASGRSVDMVMIDLPDIQLSGEHILYQQGSSSELAEDPSAFLDRLRALQEQLIEAAQQRQNSQLNMPRLIIVPDGSDGREIARQRAERLRAAISTGIEMIIMDGPQGASSGQRAPVQDVDISVAEGPLLRFQPGAVGLVLDWSIDPPQASGQSLADAESAPGTVPRSTEQRFGPGGPARRGDDVLADERWRDSTLLPGERDSQTGMDASWMSPASNPVTQEEIDRVRGNVAPSSIRMILPQPGAGGSSIQAGNHGSDFIQLDGSLNHLIAFEERVMEVRPGTWVREWTVKLPLIPHPDTLHLNAGDVIARAQQDLNQYVNRGYRTPDGAQIFVRVELEQPHDPDFYVNVLPGETSRENQRNFHPEVWPHWLGVVSHEVLHYLGLVDEYLTRSLPNGQLALNHRDPAKSGHFGRSPATGERRRVADLRNRVRDGGLMASRPHARDRRYVPKLQLLPRHVWLLEKVRGAMVDERPVYFDELRRKMGEEWATNAVGHAAGHQGGATQVSDRADDSGLDGHPRIALAQEPPPEFDRFIDEATRIHPRLESLPPPSDPEALSAYQAFARERDLWAARLATGESADQLLPGGWSPLGYPPNTPELPIQPIDPDRALPAWPPEVAISDWEKLLWEATVAGATPYDSRSWRVAGKILAMNGIRGAGTPEFDALAEAGDHVRVRLLGQLQRVVAATLARTDDARLAEMIARFYAMRFHLRQPSGTAGASTSI